MASFQVRNLGKEFPGPPPYLALQGIDLDIREGEFFCLLGASGCGKSSLLSLLAGFDSPTTGQILYRGKPILKPSKERVMFFQDAGAALLPWLTVEQNVRIALSIQSVPADEQKQRIDRALELVHLTAHRIKLPSEISGGMRQRLQIARAMAVEPDVLLMDEPFAALDAITRRRMHGALIDIWNETSKTIVFVTHDILEALTLADRIGVMTVGPGSRIAEILDVGVARPRDISHPQIAELYHRIEGLIEAGHASREFDHP